MYHLNRNIGVLWLKHSSFESISFVLWQCLDSQCERLFTHLYSGFIFASFRFFSCCSSLRNQYHFIQMEKSSEQRKKIRFKLDIFLFKYHTIPCNFENYVPFKTNTECQSAVILNAFNDLICLICTVLNVFTTEYYYTG